MSTVSLYNILQQKKHISDSCTSYGDKRARRVVTRVLILVTSLLVVTVSLTVGSNLKAEVDIDVAGNGQAAAFDGEESIATEGDSFCSITNDIAGGKFSSLFEGIVGDCDNSQFSNQFLVEYSYTKNPVKIGEETYLTLTVRDKSTGDPVPNAYVALDIKPHSPASFETDIAGAAVAAAGVSSSQELAEERTAQVVHTDSSGRATFTVQVGPESEPGVYDTELEVKKDNYQSIFEQTELRIT